MKKLRRDDKIRLFLMGENTYEGRNVKDDVVLNHDSDYFIYMKNVNFRGGNIIEGRYLGDLAQNNSIIDSHCKIVNNNGNSFTIDGNKVMTAKMVAVNNKTNVIIIIQQR